jgi:hypothetical protein
LKVARPTHNVRWLELGDDDGRDDGDDKDGKDPVLKRLVELPRLRNVSKEMRAMDMRAMDMLQSKGWKRQHDSKPVRRKDDGDLLAGESSVSVVGQSPEGLERPANDDLELKRERRWVVLDGLSVDVVRFREGPFAELLDLAL